MTYLSKHFDIKGDNLYCHCGCGFGSETRDYDLRLFNDILEPLRELICLVLGEHIIVCTSGCRCSKHNSEVGGSIDSKHLYGEAVDIKIPALEIDPTEITYKDLMGDRWLAADYIFDLCEKFIPALQNSGMGIYPPDRLHLDCRMGRARWIS